MEPYKWEPLKFVNSIRILTLYAGEALSPICTSLSEAKLDNVPEYDALSYSWATEDGKCERSNSIECDGRRIWITKNCEAALLRIRLKDSSRIVWVDAICIDQSDDDERAHQVSLMRDIYSKATKVHIWLGESSSEIDELTCRPVSDLFMEYLHRMCSEMREFKICGNHLASSPLYQNLLSWVEESFWGKYKGTQRKAPEVRGLEDLCNRRWWKRVWVVQEAASARSTSVICGPMIVSHADFRLLYQVTRTDDSFNARMLGAVSFAKLRGHFALIESSKSHSHSIHTAADVSNILRHVRGYLSSRGTTGLQASDPRDMIFGLLGLTNGLSDILPRPHYSKSAREVFTAVTKSLLLRSNSLFPLCTIAEPAFGVKCPSWVADLTRLPVIFQYPDLDDCIYNAARSSKAIFEISEDDQELRIMGKVVDGVLKLSRSHTAHTTISTLVPMWRTWTRRGLSLTEYPTGESAHDALWRTLCWNMGDKGQHPAPPNTRSLFEDWYKILTSDESIANIAEDIATHQFYYIFRGALNLFCITRDGYMGSIPRTAQVGDCIAILTGGRAPFVIRPTEDHYQLIGPCYVHGIMDGDAFSKDDGELEWIHLR